MHALPPHRELSRLEVGPGLHDPSPPIQERHINGRPHSQCVDRSARCQEEAGALENLALIEEVDVRPPPTLGQLDPVAKEGSRTPVLNTYDPHERVAGSISAHRLACRGVQGNPRWPASPFSGQSGLSGSPQPPPASIILFRSGKGGATGVPQEGPEGGFEY